ncbi:MAG: cell wall hydrolase [Lachnospiraceae bacterium]|nr:cell wall hydrolase [Lachnospiraceae bacterium]
MAKRFIVGMLLGLPISLVVTSHHYTAPRVQAYDMTKHEVVKVVEAAPEPIDYSWCVDTPKDIEAEMAADAMELLACVVEAEAGIEDELGKRLVVDTVLNRVDSDEFPDSIYDVIMQQNAFETITNGRAYEVTPTEETYRVVREELKHRTNYDVLYFCYTGYSRYGTPLFKEGRHYFNG